METQNKTDLSSYDNSWYNPGAAILRAAWYLASYFFVYNPLVTSNSWKVFVLRCFGAKVGKGVIIKPSVQIKYPWKLTIGNHCWIGEKVWIDNLARVKIGDHCCISQGALLLTGNHDYTQTTFDLQVKEIILENGVWVGARAVACPGTTCKSHAVLAVASVASKELDAYGIYKGNPAVFIKSRRIDKVEESS